ncbi:MAG: META domain-containing protein [Neisseriaceae bacterium]|nr:META domain-containing protein [Neisseriaceae bacterium PsAf]MCV2508906.1 META domain-containing protein [Neisseriaceae bacterium]
MKNKLLLLPLLALTLAACSSNSSDKLSSNDVNITDYNWHLVNAKNELNKTIPELNNTKIQVTFDNNKMNFSGGCNNFMSGIMMTKENFKTNSMASTMMACSEKLMKQDQLVGKFFDQDTIQYSTQKTDNKVILTLKNSKNELLTLEGSPNDEVLYGNDSETVFIEISAKKNNQCQTNEECYQYRFVTYDEKYSKQYSEWKSGLPEIKNYTKNPNIREIVRVKQYPTKGVEKIYVFDMRVEQETVK